MAKATKEEQALVPVNATTDALAVAPGADVNDRRGKEGIEQDDMQIEFLAIAQKSSKALDASDTGSYIEGLKLGDMYNSVTGQIYGTGPLKFIPILLRKRACLTDPKTGKMGEAVDWNDPRVTKEGAEARRAQGLKPEGQRVYDWVILLADDLSKLLVASFKSTSAPAARMLNKFVDVRPGPACSGLYTLTTTVEQNAAGKFGKFVVAPAGAPTADQYEYAQRVYESSKTRKIDVADPDEPASVVDGEVVSSQEERLPF